MHTDLNVTLDKMTVSPDLSNRMASTKDPLRRSTSSDGKRRNRQVRVQLSVYGTPRLTPNKVRCIRARDLPEADLFPSAAHLLANEFAVYILTSIRPHPRARSRNHPPTTRRGSCRMALTSTMGLPCSRRRGIESYAGTCEDEHSNAPQGQIGQIILHWPSQKIVNIAIPIPL